MIAPTLYVLAAMCLPVFAHPHNDGPLQPRQTDSFEDPETPAISISTPVTASPTESGFFGIPTSSTSSSLIPLDPACESSVLAFASSVPKPASEVVEFSESFYLTATRTATATEEECAWITSTPDSVDDLVVDWVADMVEWAQEPDTLEQARGVAACVPEGYEADDLCSYELGILQRDLTSRIADRLRQRSGTPGRATMAAWGIAMASFVSVLLML